MYGDTPLVVFDAIVREGVMDICEYFATALPAGLMPMEPRSPPRAVNAFPMATDRVADFLSLLSCSDLAGADRPDGLICDDHGSSLLSSDADQIALELQTDPVDRDACFSLLERLAAAKDGSKAILESLENLSVQESIILFVIISSLGVADDNNRLQR